MSKIAFDFDSSKATEAILYLISKDITDSDKYNVCKLLYLADKLSLEKYGRFIFGETYVAMEQGATPSNTYDLLKEAAISPFNGIKVEGNTVSSQRKPNLDYLSKSDIECLNNIVDEYGKETYHRRRADAHDVAWEKNWTKRGSKNSVRIPIEDIAELLDDSENLIDYLSNVG